MALLLVLPLLHLAAGAVILAAPRRAGRWCLVAAAGPMALAVVVLGIESGPVLDGVTRRWSGEWIGGLGVQLSFGLDGFAWLLGTMVAGVGVLVVLYAASYFDSSTAPRDLGRFAGLFVAFGGAMLGLVLADDVWTLFVFWELTSVLSFLLIGLDDEDATARAAALRALLVTSAGGLAMLGGFAILVGAAGSSSLAAIAEVETGPLVEVALVLVLLGAFTKSAQVPFHFWLPGAMAAPTPVSAYLHSATMVKAGVILVARLAPAFGAVRWWAPLLVLVGTATMVIGGTRAMRQHDAKLLLAHGTVSQLGLMMILFGIGVPDVTAAAVAVLVAHVAFKAALFLAVGIVDHATGTRDLRRVQGVGRSLPWVAGLAVVAGASMIGLPPTLGFVAKEAALAALLDAPGAWAVVAVAGVSIGSVLTVAYTLRLLVGLFGDAVDARAGEPATVHHRPSVPFTVPAAVLVGITIAGGLAAGPLGDRLAVAAIALDPAAHGHLVLWPGLGAPLVLSAVIVGAGSVLAWVRSRGAEDRVVGAQVRWPSAQDVYQRSFDGLLALSRRVAAVVQNGSLPSYLLVVFAVVAAALGIALVGGVRIGDAPLVVADSVPQAVVAALVGLVALGVAMARRRFMAVLLLGGMGYGLALLFFLAGAPDLALTQLLVETVMVVVFLLVLRNLPEGYAPPPSWAPVALRLGVATAVGVTVTAFVLVAGTARTEAPVTDAITARSEADAGGRNVVNVILVDFRAMDTLGEITVLALGAVGVANLVRAARRDSGHHGVHEGLTEAPAGRGGRSLVLDEVVRLLVPVLLVVSVYVTFRGHNAPGGGFAGGLLAGVALLLRFLATGQPTLGRHRIAPAVLLAVGLLIAAGTGVSGMVYGQLLESALTTVDVPLVGPVKVVSSTVFDVGVYLVVVGSVLATVSNLGADPTPRPGRDDRQEVAR